MESRQDAEADVSFDEMKMWLCDHPDSEPFTSDQYNIEESKLTNHNYDIAEKDYENYKSRQVLQ